MFWKGKKLDAPIRKPGITGTGRFIENAGWTLWDDTHSPGLIGHDRFDKLKKLVLTERERSNLAMYMVRDATATKGPKHTPTEDKEVEPIFAKLNAYLVDIRRNRFDELAIWLDSNLMRDKDGRVVREDGTRAANIMLSPIKAYLNCLGLWGFGYRWEEIEDSKCEPALLIHRKDPAGHVIVQSEVQYVQGKPYRFSIQMQGVAWYFEDKEGFFEIVVQGEKRAIF